MPVGRHGVAQTIHQPKEEEGLFDSEMDVHIAGRVHGVAQTIHQPKEEEGLVDSEMDVHVGKSACCGTCIRYVQCAVPKP
eukprot:scaffold29924_cov18-Tisochrysis_lutea.AAC.4